MGMISWRQSKFDILSFKSNKLDLKHEISLIRRLLKETRNSFKKWPFNLWWISKKIIMKIGNVIKAATFKSFLHQSYKNTQLLFLVTVLFNYFPETNINRWFLAVTQKQELRVSFKYWNFLKEHVA